MKINLAINVSDENRVQTGSLDLDKQGTLVLDIASPRPLRMWFDGILVLDEPINWMRYQRRLLASIIFPVSASRLNYRLEVGPKPLWPSFVDEHSPSRVREQIRSALQERHADLVKINGDVQAGVNGFATSIRYSETHTIKDAVTYQRTVISPILGFFSYQPSHDTNDATLLQPNDCSLLSSIAPFESIEVSNATELSRGRRAFLLPVANKDNAIPAVRTSPIETVRIEPEIQTAFMLDVQLKHLKAKQDKLNFLMLDRPDLVQPSTVALKVPVYEARGRAAPLREYTKLGFPASTSELLTKVPRPILPAKHSAWSKLYDYSWDVIFRLYYEPRQDTGMVSAYFRTAMHGFHDSFFVWDSAFATLALAYGFRAFNALANFDNLYARQFDGGYIHREHSISEGIPAAFEPDFSPNPPLMSFAEWHAFCLSGDLQRIKTVYPLLAAHHAWLVQNRRLPDGTYWTTGLANGLDNSPSLGEGYPDLTAQMIHEAEILANMARVLGKLDEANKLEQERRATADAMNAHLWSESLQFYSTSLVEGGHNPNKVVTGFWPLWTGLVPDDRIEALSAHLLDKKSFDRPHPVPSLAADAPDYDPHGNYWRGSVWAPTNCAVIKGFERSGRHDMALRTITKHLDAMCEVYTQTGTLWENYSADFITKGAIGGPDYSWSAVGPIALLLEIVLGLSAQAHENKLTWLLPDEAGFGVENYALGTATIALQQDFVDSSSGKERRLQVKTDKRFTLEVQAGKVRRRQVFEAGEHQVFFNQMEDVPASG